MRIGSLFSGYGGTDLAVQSVLGGGHVVWHSDIKPAAVALLAHKHPDVPNLGDMTAIDYSSAPPIDVLAASWPCQPHSAAGKRLGEKDPRALWPHVARAIAETRPAFFFGENVARITGNGELRRVIRSLAEIGYVGAWRCVRASDIGACHQRDRCFVVAVDPAAYAGGEAGWFAGDTEQGHVSRSAGVGSAESGRRDHGAGLNLLPTPAAQNAKGPARRGDRRDGYARTVRQTNLPGAIELLPTPKASDGEKGFIDWGRYTEAIRRHELVVGRPAPEPTQLSLKNGNPQLSARFVEWMMMLPEGWVTDVPGLVDSPRKSERNAMLSLLGDGVVPAQGAAAFRFLLEHLAERFDGEVAA